MAIIDVKTANAIIPAMRHFFGPIFSTLCPNIVNVNANDNTTIISIIPVIILLW